MSEEDENKGGGQNGNETASTTAVLEKPTAPSVKPRLVPIGGGNLVQLIEATEPTGKEWEVMLIEKGLSKNKYNYSESVLREAAPLFNGVYSFADHTNETEQRVRPERSVKDKAGRFSGATYGTATIDGRLVEGVKAHLKVIAPWLRDLLRESVEMGESDFVGFSIDALGQSVKDKKTGISEVKRIQRVYSVDVVTNPSAGGRLMRLVASDGEGRNASVDDENEGGGIAVATPPKPTAAGEVITMAPAELARIIREETAKVLADATKPLQESLAAQTAEVTKLQEAQRVQTQRERINSAVDAAAGLSTQGAERLRNSFYKQTLTGDIPDEDLLDSIKESVAYEAALLQQNMHGPTSTPRVHVGASEADKHYQAMVGFFENADQVVDGKTIPRYRSIKEAYCRFTGRDNFEVSAMEIQSAFGCKYDSEIDHQRIKESVQTATWGQVYADVLYLMLIKAYRANPVYNKWRAVVSDIENVPDFQTRHWTRLGGYGDLIVVPEAGTYQPMVSSTNEEVKYAVSKRGGLDDVTFEAVANDRVGAIRRIPLAMARSAARTLFKFVMNGVTTDNPVMNYDSVTLYHASHANTNTVALSLTGLQTATVAMRQQTAFSETSEILGERNKPKTLIVPTQLELLAQRLINPSDAYLAAIANPSTEQSLDPQAFKGAGLDYIVYDVLTSATGWYAVADPNEVATYVIGFLNGKEDPELFVQDQPNVGSNFTADKVTYKVRHIYGGVQEDHRSFYRGNT